MQEYPNTCWAKLAASCLARVRHSPVGPCIALHITATFLCGTKKNWESEVQHNEPDTGAMENQTDEKKGVTLMFSFIVLLQSILSLVLPLYVIEATFSAMHEANIIAPTLAPLRNLSARFLGSNKSAVTLARIGEPQQILSPGSKCQLNNAMMCKCLEHKRLCADAIVSFSRPESNFCCGFLRMHSSWVARTLVLAAWVKGGEDPV